MTSTLRLTVPSPAITCVLSVLLLVGAAASSHAQTAENVAIVINETSIESVRIGEYYAKIRKIPSTNVIRIRTTSDEDIEREAYAQSVERPIEAVLGREGLQDRILYLVLIKGVPLRIQGTAGRSGTAASVDSELTLLYRRMTGRAVPTSGAIPNPYFLGDRPLRDARPFSHREHDIFLVARLDAFTTEDTLALIDRAQAAVTTGRIVLDQRGVNGGIGDRWLGEAAARIQDLGHSTTGLGTPSSRIGSDLSDVLGYYSWGSTDPENRTRRLGLGFVPGALAATFMSADARTFQVPPKDWAPGSETMDRRKWFRGSPQSLSGDLLREGATGVAGNVAEPYLDGAVRPDILFPTYLGGANLVEAFYLALPNLSSQTVIVGDPLCAPFRQLSLTAAQIEDPLDPRTELPGLFASRRVAAAQAGMKDVPAQVVALLVKAHTQLRRGDKAAAMGSLEEATGLHPAATDAQLQLAAMHEEAGQVDQAMARYRQVLERQPRNVIALNNLAYSLAVKKNSIEEGLTLARRAVALAPKVATIVDTLAWIEHLRGNDAEAARLLGPFVQIVEKGTGDAQIHLHAAMILAALKDDTAAAAQLTEALRLDPQLASNPDVKELRARLAVKDPRGARMISED